MNNDRIDIRSETDKNYGISIAYNGYNFYRVDVDEGHDEYRFLDQTAAIEPMNVPPDVREELEPFVDEYIPNWSM